MKSHLLLLVFVLPIVMYNCGHNETKLTDTQKAKVEELKKEVHSDLTDNLLPWWSARSVDYLNGGFYGRINHEDSIIADANKGGILNARILWTYSAAYRTLKDTAYLTLATRARDYIFEHFIDKEYGGAFWSVDAMGKPVDTRKQLYTNAFFIYGLSEYSRATGDKESLEAAKAIFNLVEEHALDREANGYFEIFDREWKRIRDRMIGESSDNDEKTMNTSLHLMEAYANLYRVWPVPEMADRLRNLVEIFLDKIIDEETYHLICFMDRNWNRTSQVDSYGHDIEASWLLCESADLLGDQELIRRVRETAVKMAETVEEAIQPNGSIIYEKDLASGHVNANRSWWAQSETIVGYLNAFELSGDEKFLDYSINCWRYTFDHHVDHVNGGWFPNVRETDETSWGDKAGHWICPYHNGRMAMEVAERVERMINKK